MSGSIPAIQCILDHPSVHLGFLREVMHDVVLCVYSINPTMCSSKIFKYHPSVSIGNHLPPEFPWILLDGAGQMSREGRSSTNLNIKEAVIKADSSDWFFNLRSVAWVFALLCIPGQLMPPDPRLLLLVLLLLRPTPPAAAIPNNLHIPHISIWMRKIRK